MKLSLGYSAKCGFFCSSQEVSELKNKGVLWEACWHPLKFCHPHLFPPLGFLYSWFFFFLALTIQTLSENKKYLCFTRGILSLNNRHRWVSITQICLLLSCTFLMGQWSLTSLLLATCAFMETKRRNWRQQHSLQGAGTTWRMTWDLGMRLWLSLNSTSRHQPVLAVRIPEQFT